MGEYNEEGEWASIYAHYADPTEVEREARREYHATKRKARREYLNSVKNVPCEDCGVQYPPYVMDFDHVRGEKLYELSDMTFRSMSAIIEEVKKCDIICSNCHRERTYRRDLTRVT